MRAFQMLFSDSKCLTLALLETLISSKTWELHKGKGGAFIENAFIVCNTHENQY